MKKSSVLALAAAMIASPIVAQEDAPDYAPTPAPPVQALEAPPAPAPDLAADAQPVKAEARPVVVTAGEHGDYSRVVVAGAGATLSQSGRVVKIALDTSSDADLSVLASGKRAKRVAGARLRPADGGNEIILDLACDCRVASSRLPNGKFIIDIFDGPRIGPTPSQAALSTAQSTQRQPATASRVPAGASPGAAAVAAPNDVVSGAAAGRASGAELGSNVITAGADKLSVDEARKRMVALLQQAADDGIITVKPGSDELSAPAPLDLAKPATGPVQLGKPATPLKASIPGKPPIAPGSPGSVQTPIAPVGDDAPPPLSPAEPVIVATARSQAGCLPDAAFAIDGRKFAQTPLQEIAAIEAALNEAEVDAKPALAERLALGYLAIGFGEEALGALSRIGDSRSLYADLARVAAEKRPAADGLLMRGAECRGAHALWLAAVEDPQSAAKSAARAGDAINAVPVRLRAALAARIARTLVAAGDAPAARQYYRTALAAAGKTPELKFVEAKLLELEGKGDAAHAILDHLEHENGGSAKDALAELSDDDARDGVGEDLGVLAKSARGTADEGRAALREASFWADSGAIESGVFLLRDAARRDAAVAPEAVRKARDTIAAAFASGEPKKRLAALAAYLHDKDFLQSTGGDADIATLASDAAIELGVPNAALSILKAPAVAAGLGPARIARAALAADAAEEAVAAAAPYADQPDFANVLVKANIELGRGYAALAAASALADSPEKAALTAEAAWRAGDYKSAARAFSKIAPSSLSVTAAERFGYAAYMAGEPALPSAAEAVLQQAQSPSLARLQVLFKRSVDGPIVERGKDVVAGAGADIKLIEEMLGG